MMSFADRLAACVADLEATRLAQITGNEIREVADRYTTSVWLEDPEGEGSGWVDDAMQDPGETDQDATDYGRLVEALMTMPLPGDDGYVSTRTLETAAS